MLPAELILHEHNYTLPGAGERRSQEEVRHGARDSDCCPADSLTTVTMSHVEEKQEEVRHGASDSACCPADSLTTVTMSHVEEKLEEDRHGASVAASCSADSLTSAAVVASYVKEDKELLSHLETLEDIKEDLCFPAEPDGPNGDANHLTRLVKSHSQVHFVYLAILKTCSPSDCKKAPAVFSTCHGNYLFILILF